MVKCSECKTKASFGFKKGEPKYCTKHKKGNPYNVVALCCSYDRCRIRLNYSRISQFAREYCSEHDPESVSKKVDRISIIDQTVTILRQSIPECIVTIIGTYMGIETRGKCDIYPMVIRCAEVCDIWDSSRELVRMETEREEKFNHHQKSIPWRSENAKDLKRLTARYSLLDRLFNVISNSPNRLTSMFRVGRYMALSFAIEQFVYGDYRFHSRSGLFIHPEEKLKKCIEFKKQGMFYYMAGKVVENNDYWICHDTKENMERTSVGKWVLFYDKTILEQKWETIKALYDNDDIVGVYGMQCSIDKDNERASDKSHGVIIMYCENSDGEEYIKLIGRNIREKMEYDGMLYYNTDAQTKQGRYSV